MDSLLAHLTTVFTHAPIGLCLSRHRVVVVCNRHFAGMFRFKPEELAGQSFAVLYPSLTEFENTGARGLPVMQATGAFRDERIMMRRNGEYFWCRVTGHSVDRRDPFAQAVWCFEDMSAERPVLTPLTKREREIAALVVSGKTSKQIGKLLDISPRTVEAHRVRLMKKLGVATATELVQRLLGVPR